MSTHKTGETAPKFVEYGVDFMRRYYLVNLNITGDEGNYSWDEIQTPVGSLDYSFLVSEIIRLQYSEDKMEATINNYLKDMTNPDYKQAFDDMQAYRDWAKLQAKEAREFAAAEGIWDPESEKDPEEQPGEDEEPGE
jgi:hypothetical protein